MFHFVSFFFNLFTLCAWRLSTFGLFYIQSKLVCSIIFKLISAEFWRQFFEKLIGFSIFSRSSKIRMRFWRFRSFLSGVKEMKTILICIYQDVEKSSCGQKSFFNAHERWNSSFFCFLCFFLSHIRHFQLSCWCKNFCKLVKKNDRLDWKE